MKKINVGQDQNIAEF